MAKCSECGAELQGQRRVVCGERCKSRRKMRLARERYAMTAAIIPDRECPWCGVIFSPKTWNQVICGDAECDRKRRNANRKSFYGRYEGSHVKYGQPLNPMRKCHDCGEPTYNYRCDKCKAKWRAAYEVVE